jgi:serine/threonine-protein kinase
MNPPDPITRLNAALEGRYLIESELGEGGMATVYLADDIKHERKVALKVLKPELAAVVGADRFLAEIKTTANLQHPHILPLFDSGEADSFLFYVMPYVEGETLQERIDREKQLPVAEAVRIAADIAEALEHAHRQGIIHRDIKPANVLMSNGRPLIADFGIALAVGVAGGDRLTETGLSVGTPWYMSPEQATGDQQVGPASDTYSLAAVLYEMLTAEPPFTGRTAQAVLGRIIQGALVSVSETRKSVPVNVDHAIRKALERLPADRFTGVGEFAAALGQPGFRYADPSVGTRSERNRLWKGISIGSTILAAGFGVAFVWAVQRSPERQVMYAPLALADEQELVPVGSPSVALSRDGTRLVYTGSWDGSQMLLLRRMDRLEVEPVTGTAGAHDPFFSPDGSAVGFFSGGKLRTVSLVDGRSLTLADVPTSRGGTWSDDGYVYYAAGTVGGLRRVRETGGGESETVTQLLASHRWPSALPGGAGVLVGTYAGDAAYAGIAVVPPGDSARLVIEHGLMPQYSATGHLVFVDLDGAVQAVPFDLETLETTGPVFTVFEGVSVDLSSVGADISLAQDGTLAYVSGSSVYGLVRVDRNGVERVLADSLLGLEAVRVSPDGRQLAMSMQERTGMAVMVYDIAGGASRRLTFDGTARYPSWHPMGDRLVFSLRTPSTDGVDLYEVSTNGGEPPTPVYQAPFDQYEGEWTPDGERLAIRETTPVRGRYVVSFEMGDDSVRSVLRTPFNDRAIALSPDGRRIAYVSDESGVDEVYVRDFPGPGGRLKVSVNGGGEPRWSADGRELFYRNMRSFVAVPIRDGPVFQYGQEQVLFADVYARNGDHGQYGVDPTGEFFYLPQSATRKASVVLVFNWSDALLERMPN